MMSGITIVDAQAIFDHTQHMTCTSMHMRKDGRVVMVMEGVDLPVTTLVFDPDWWDAYNDCQAGPFVTAYFEEH
jgi:hypothetical protein